MNFLLTLIKQIPISCNSEEEAKALYDQVDEESGDDVCVLIFQLPDDNPQDDLFGDSNGLIH